jgi:LysR family hydrogen peroxide-inducible transcriptional activator
VHESTTGALLKSCTDGEIDLAILALPIDAPHLRAEELFEEELVLVLPADHALVDRERIRASDIEPYPFVLLDEAHCLSSDIVSYCRKRSFRPLAVERTSQLAMVQELVSLSHGISLIPAMAREIDHGPRRVYRSMAAPRPARRVAVAWNPQRFQGRLVQRFREFLKEYGAGPGRAKGRRRSG